MNYSSLELQIINWVWEQPAIRALVMVGSRARREFPADEWSDLDLILFTTDIARFVEEPYWINQFGEVWIQVLQFTRAGDAEWLVVYAGGFKVDFFFAPLSAPLQEMLFTSRFTAVTRRGVCVLVDKDSKTPITIPEERIIEREKPSETEVTAVTQKFWLYTYRTANMLRRGDLWRAQTILNAELRPALLHMLAWHAQAAHGLALDTWYDGRFLQEWADPRAVAAIPATFSSYETKAMRAALLAMVDLFDWLSRETAELWQYPDPKIAQRPLLAWIRDMDNESKWSG